MFYFMQNKENTKYIKLRMEYRYHHSKNLSLKLSDLIKQEIENQNYLDY